SAAPGDSNVSVIVTGTSASGSGFYDPGSGFPNHLAASVSGTGVTVNSVTFTDPTHFTMNISVAAGATGGARDVTVTNPDGQTAVGTGIFAIKKPNGATCGAGSECASGNCVGGICCSSACNCGTCGTGTCVAGGVAAPGTPSCSPYVCNAAST